MGICANLYRVFLRNSANAAALAVLLASGKPAAANVRLDLNAPYGAVGVGYYPPADAERQAREHDAADQLLAMASTNTSGGMDAVFAYDPDGNVYMGNDICRESLFAVGESCDCIRYDV